MTDELIIKNFRNGVYKNKPMLFGQKFLESVLDLINRQAAEIEELKTEIERMENQNTLLLKQKCKDINTARKIIKSEAIKEFAEKLKEKLQWDVEFDNKLVFESDIDSLVKEMTEER